MSFPDDNVSNSMHLGVYRGCSDDVHVSQFKKLIQRGRVKIEDSYQATGPCRYQHNPILGVFPVKHAYTKVPPGTGSTSVEPHILEFLSATTAQLQEVLTAVQHTSKTGENEDFLLLFHDQLFDDLVEYDELSRRVNHMFANIIGIRLGMRENVWVVATLRQIS